MTQPHDFGKRPKPYVPPHIAAARRQERLIAIVFILLGVALLAAAVWATWFDSLGLPAVLGLCGFACLGLAVIPFTDAA